MVCNQSTEFSAAIDIVSNIVVIVNGEHFDLSVICCVMRCGGRGGRVGHFHPLNLENYV